MVREELRFRTVRTALITVVRTHYLLSLHSEASRRKHSHEEVKSLTGRVGITRRLSGPRVSTFMPLPEMKSVGSPVPFGAVTF